MGRIKVSLQDLKAATFDIAPHKDLNECVVQWNRRFGAIGDLSNVTTVVEKKETVVSGKDLLLRLSMRVHKFENVTGLDDDPALAYAKAAEKLSSKPAALMALDALLQDLNTRNNVWSYFQYPSPGTFNLSGDYQAIQALTPGVISDSRATRPLVIPSSLTESSRSTLPGCKASRS